MLDGLEPVLLVSIVREGAYRAHLIDTPEVIRSHSLVHSAWLPNRSLPTRYEHLVVLVLG